MNMEDAGEHNDSKLITLQNEVEEYEEEDEEEEDEEEEETDDEEPRLCGVCGDLAKGYHFNALTCEGCKGFFRRAIKRSKQLHCPYLNNCIITKNNRRSCQACRFRKCRSIGMRKEMVMSDKEILERRIRISKKRLRPVSTQLSSQQEQVIQELLRGHRSTFDPTFSHFKGLRPIDKTLPSLPAFEPLYQLNSSDSRSTSSDPDVDPPLSSPGSISPSFYSFSSSLCSVFDQQENNTVKNGFVFTALPHVADLSTYMIHDVVRFSKSLQAFRSLSIEDQISLLKGATFEIKHIRFNMVFNSNSSRWICGNNIYCIDDAVRAGFQPPLLDPLLRFHHTLRKLNLQDEEYVLMEAMSLFSPDRQGVEQRRVVDRIHESLALTLKTWIDCRRTEPEKHLLYPKIIGCFTEMRTMSEEYNKQILQIQDMQPDTISPLNIEVVSKHSDD